MHREVKAYLAAIGRKGGRKSRRVLASDSAREMVRLREARRAFKNFYTQCFWSYRADYPIGKSDIQWVAQELMKNGGRRGYLIGVRLCR